MLRPSRLTLLVVLSFAAPASADADADSADSASNPVVGLLPKEAIRKVIHANRNQFRSCFVSQLDRFPTLEGKVAIRFIISAAGSVSESSVASSTVNNAELEACVAARVQRLDFPKPEGGGIVIVTYPFTFGQSPSPPSGPGTSASYDGSGQGVRGGLGLRGSGIDQRAQAAGPSPVAPPPRPSRRPPSGLSGGLRLGYALPVGDFAQLQSGRTEPLSEEFHGQIPFVLEAGYRFARYFTAGAYLQAGYPFLVTTGQGIAATECHLAGIASCSGNAVLRTGLQLFFSFTPDATFQPWVGVGAGYEEVIYVLKDGHGGSASIH